MKIRKWYEADPLQAQAYDDAVERMRYALGKDGKRASYDAIAQVLYARTGQTTAGQSVRRWLKDRSLPLHWATSLVDACEGAITVFDFFPWLRPYCETDESFLD